MGEIKSTLELVMERTRGMVQSREEREQDIFRERARKAAVLAEKHLSGETGLAAFVERLDALSGREPGFDARAAARLHLARTLPLDGAEGKTALAALACLGSPHVREMEEAMEKMAGETEEAEKQAEARLAAELAGRGISGSAAVLRPRTDPGYEKARAAIRERARARIARLAEAAGQDTPRAGY
jgi:hypothetical protein